MPVIATVKRVRFVQGNAACAQAALDAGVRFFAGYPITPSSEIAEILSGRLPRLGGTFIQMEDEIASIGAILGASLAGEKVMTATSGPGFSLMQELIGFGCLCEIPCVIVSVQRGGPSTGLPTLPSQADVMQARWGTHGDHPIIVFAPSSVKEMYDLTVHAINVAESLRTPVILLSDEVIAHMYEKIEFPDPATLTLLKRPDPPRDKSKKYLPFETKKPSDIPRVANFGDGFRFHVTGLMHDVDGFPTSVPEKTGRLMDHLHEKINARLKDICLWESEGMDGASVVVCSYGSTARSCAQAIFDIREQSMPVGFIRLKTLWPFPDFIFRKLPDAVRKVIVCEMNMGQIAGEVERSSRGRFEVISMTNNRGTMITPQEIVKRIKECV